MTQNWTGTGSQGPYVGTERWATLEERLPDPSPEEIERARIAAWKAEHTGNEPRRRRVARVAGALIELKDELDEVVQPPVQSNGYEIAEFDIEPPKDVLTAKEIAEAYHIRSPRCVTLAFYELLDLGLLENTETTGKYSQYRDGKRAPGLKMLRIDTRDQASVIALLVERGEIVPDGVEVTTRIDDIRKMVKNGAENPKSYAVYTDDGAIHYGVTTDKQTYDEWVARTTEVLPKFDQWTMYFKKVSQKIDGGLTPYVLTQETISSVSRNSPLPRHTPSNQ